MHTLTTAAVEPARLIVSKISADQFDRRTPCPDFDVRGLVDHLLTWGPGLVSAADKAPPAASYPDLETYLDAIATAWGRPAAWTGTITMGGQELPAATMGGMVLGEVVVHGWDLARATGQEPTWDEELLVFLHDEVARTADQGRAMNLYGPPVPVAAGASTLDRMLGLTGRDPAWTA